MANKTYHQYCALACALDVLGERWTLLVIRNLLGGPKRFTDLLRGLPGISTNVLTERLHLLGEQGVIETRVLPPPAASTVYTLTAGGFGLVGVLGALAQWGAARMGAPQDGEAVPVESVVFMILGTFWRAGRTPPALRCTVVVEDGAFTGGFAVTMGAEGFQIQENAAAAGTVHLRLGLEPLLRLSSGQATLAGLEMAGRVVVEGAAAQVLRDWVDGETR